MTDMKSIGELRATGQAMLVRPPRTQLLGSIAEMFDGKANKHFGPLHDVEHTPIDQIRATAVKDTVFEPIDETLAAQGLPTDGTVGGVMDILDLTQNDVHNLACYCHREFVAGSEAADYMRGLAASAG